MRFSCGALRRLLIRSPWSLIDFLDSASFQTDSQIVAIDRIESRFLQILNTDIIDADSVQRNPFHSHRKWPIGFQKKAPFLPRQVHSSARSAH